MKTLRTPLSSFLLAITLLSVGASRLSALDYVWTGATNGDITLGINWDTTPLGPLGLGIPDENLFFGAATTSTVTVDSSLLSALGYVVTLNDITFTDTTNYTFAGLGSTPVPSLKFNGNFESQAANTVTFNNTLNLQLSGTTHSVDTAADSTIVVNSDVSGSGASITKTGAGTLILNGSNTFSGGFNLTDGWLLVGSDSALGNSTGTLALTGGTLSTAYTDPMAPVDFSINNAISITNGIKLMDCDTYNGLTFNGAISGTGQFDVHGYGNLSLNHDNSSWSGGINFYGANSVFINDAHALGTGPVTFDYTSETNVYIGSGINASIGTLSGGDYETGDAVINLDANASLTINQSTDEQFDGNIVGYNVASTYDGGLVKNGAGTLTLAGYSDYHGPTVINQGGLIINGDHGGSLTFTSSVTVNSGGTLGVRSDGWVNSLVTVNSGGKLIGDGFISEAIIGSGATLSPGDAGSPLGTLHFEDLTLEGGGKLEFNVMFDGVSSFYTDGVIVQNSSTLTNNATSGNRFTLKIISLDNSYQAGALAGGISEGNTYTWMLFDTNGIFDITSGNSAITIGSFDIDASQFSASLTGTFSLSQAGNDISLNFTPVPEPSTYVLMGLGLAGSGLAAWRKSRRKI